MKSHSPRPLQLNEWRQPENSPKQQDYPEFILGCGQMIQAWNEYGRSWKEPPWLKLSMLGAIGAASYQTDAMRRIAESHPNLTIVIGCLTQPTPTAESHLWRRWTEQLELSLLPACISIRRRCRHMLPSKVTRFRRRGVTWRRLSTGSGSQKSCGVRIYPPSCRTPHTRRRSAWRAPI